MMKTNDVGIMFLSPEPINYIQRQIKLDDVFGIICPKQVRREVESFTEENCLAGLILNAKSVQDAFAVRFTRNVTTAFSVKNVIRIYGK
jgi:hypothetical protein